MVVLVNAFNNATYSGTKMIKQYLAKKCLTKNSLAKKCRLLFISFATLITLSGCVTALVAGVVITTVDILHDRRTAGEYIDDAAIELTARNITGGNKEIRSQAHIKSQSWNGILLVTGEVENEQVKQILLPKLSKIQGVRQVVDETTILGKSKLLTRANDSWIATRVKSLLVLKTGLAANRIKIVTTRRNVYLMGIVTQAEADKATELARTVKGVTRVVKVFEYIEKDA